MKTCNPYFWVSLGLVLVGVLTTFVARRRPGENRKAAPSKQLWVGLFLIAAGGVLYATGVAKYPDCTRINGACPAGFPPGSKGWTCTNEYTQCAWRGNCLTVKGTMPWDSTCECKCTR